MHQENFYGTEKRKKAAEIVAELLSKLVLPTPPQL